MGDRISVIIPCLNEAGQIGSLLESLQPLRSRGGELILVDGGSTDDTCELARGLVDKIIPGERGRAVQMNTGAGQANGDILWFLHADSRVDTGHADSLRESLARSGRCWGRFDVYLSGRPALLRLVAFMMNWRSRLTGIATGDQGIFVTRACFGAVQGYRSIPLMEDVELSRCLKRHSRPVCLRRRLVTSGRRWERDGVMRTVLLMWRLRLAYALGADPADLARQYRECSTPVRES
jgi:rSAM/selenodomain-associated transferase 2